jgi:membrane-associated phospholipid phosphatase
MRPPEWLFIAYFAYVALLSALLTSRPQLHFQPLAYLLFSATVFALLNIWQRGPLGLFVRNLRDWLPLLFTLIAFREMDLFTPAKYNLAFEASWIKLDQLLLGTWGLRAGIESLGKVLPFYLEFCYLLVYALAAYSVACIVARADRRTVDYFWCIYLTGTLTAYALFPYFPSLPPRYAFPLVSPPTVTTWVRTFNLWLLRGATIHSGVFPSAHVSSAFSCAWAFYLIFPRRHWLGHSMLFYAISVSLATVYGRYHYFADVLAGFAVSLVALGVGLALNRRGSAGASPNKIEMSPALGRRS